jgi:hypothetical protein
MVKNRQRMIAGHTDPRVNVHEWHERELLNLVDAFLEDREKNHVKLSGGAPAYLAMQAYETAKGALNRALYRFSKEVDY